MFLLKKAIISLFLLQGLVGANQIDQSKSVIEKTNEQLKGYQKKINQLDDKSKVLLDEYKHTNKELQNTKKYNEQLEAIIRSQKEEIAGVDKQLQEIGQTHKNIYPLMSEMIISLKELIKADTPFLLKERQDRVTRLEQSLDRSDINTAEKFRILLEAFKIEYDYANSIETYEDKIDGKTYNMLRVGRVGLYYQSLDLSSYGYWNNESKIWTKIDTNIAKANIRKAIRIANKQQNVELLALPFLTSK